MRTSLAALALCLCMWFGPAERASGQSDASALSYAPYAPLVREHFYRQLRKSPWRALGYELLLPGAGSLYTGLHAPAVGTLGVSLVGASLWVAGALRDRRALAWAGIGTFAAARSYGLVSAPVGAVLLNAAFRHQLGIVSSF
jgi:hypothetical protein